jgi:hypothetical protein
MTIKFPSMPKIGHVNPISAVKSAARAAKHKLLSSGSKRDLTKVRSGDQPEHKEAGSCLELLANSKGKSANFYSQAFEEADKLVDRCFQGNASIGYNAVEESIFKDFAIWLKAYDASAVKKIDREAKEAKKVAFIGNADNLKVKSRTRMMDGIINECAKRLQELKKKPASRADVSTAPTAPATTKPVPELSFRPTPARDAPADAPAKPPTIAPAPARPANAVTTERNPDLVAAAKMIAAINRGDLDDFLGSLDEFHQLQHKTTGEIFARNAQMKYAFENRPPRYEQIEAFKIEMAKLLKNPVLLGKHQAKIDEIKRAWLTVQTFFPEQRQETQPHARPISARVDGGVSTQPVRPEYTSPAIAMGKRLHEAIAEADIPEFFRTLHAIKRMPPDEQDRVYEIIKAAASATPLQRMNLVMLNNLMERLDKGLPDGKMRNQKGLPDGEMRNQFIGLNLTWLALKEQIPALRYTFQKGVESSDLMAANDTLADLAGADPTSR